MRRTLGTGGVLTPKHEAKASSTTVGGSGMGTNEARLRNAMIWSLGLGIKRTRGTAEFRAAKKRDDGQTEQSRCG
jgi:hypothetical protein